jgi:uncharacterized protein YutD
MKNVIKYNQFERDSYKNYDNVNEGFLTKTILALSLTISSLLFNVDKIQAAQPDQIEYSILHDDYDDMISNLRGLSEHLNDKRISQVLKELQRLRRVRDAGHHEEFVQRFNLIKPRLVQIVKDYGSVASSILGFDSCISAKQSKSVPISDASKVIIPFSSVEYQSDLNFLRARASSSSKYDLEAAMSEADLLAKGKIASDLDALVKRVIKTYTSMLKISGKEEFSRNTEDMMVGVAKQHLTNVKTIGEKAIKDKSGATTYWIVKEINLNPIKDEAAASISKDERIKQMFNEAEFKKTFDAEILKYENEQKK